VLISRSVLPNGLRVVTERMPGVRSVSIGFWVGAGSRDEPPGLQGSSHFLEHLLFKGTEKRTARDIAEAFDAVGGEANAFSAKEYTCVHGRVLDADLPMCADFLSDMVCAPALREEDVANERRVILEEIAMQEDTPDDLVHDLFAEATFGDHPLARPILGTAETVSAITPGSLGDFHRGGYRAGNVVVSAAGNVDHEELVSRIAGAFPPEETGGAAREPAQPSPAGRLRVITRATEQAHLIVGGLGLSRRHPDRFAWGLLDNLLGGGMSSRLFQEIRERRGLAYSIYSYRNPFGETGLYAIYVGTMPGNVGEALNVISEELDRVMEAGVTEAELERAKGHTRGALVLSLEDPSSRMTRLGRSELLSGEILSIDELVARVDGVTLEDVSRVARDLLRPESRVLAAIGPLTEGDFPGWT
jgi:predicted Zn-dependent peptidase